MRGQIDVTSGPVLGQMPNQHVWAFGAVLAPLYHQLRRHAPPPNVEPRTTTMPNTLQIEQPKDEIKQGEHRSRNQLIRELVLHVLGVPADMRRVQVRKLWENHYRVNVLVGVDGGAMRIGNSYFLVIDSDGMLIAATPEITKQY